MHRSRLEEGAPQLSAADARKKIMRAHVVALMLDAQEVSIGFKDLIRSFFTTSSRSMTGGCELFTEDET